MNALLTLDLLLVVALAVLFVLAVAWAVLFGDRPAAGGYWTHRWRVGHQLARTTHL